MGRKLVLLLVAAALVAGTADARPRDDRAPLSSRVSGVPALQDRVLTAINDLRKSNGLSELTLNPALSLAALGHSQSMAMHGYFTHEGWNGSPFWTRIKPKYRPQLGNRWFVGENLIWASPDLSADQAIQIWLDSAPHRKNLLTPAWREVGLGAVRALDAPGVYKGLDVTILTADFGVR
ncbi:MAG TPA: CAP domain-containing protein [Gaiellaceae bacterium]|nr:CAP domain-containing protein [Gaiellaceae bacterium]